MVSGVAGGVATATSTGIVSVSPVRSDRAGAEGPFHRASDSVLLRPYQRCGKGMNGQLSQEEIQAEYRNGKPLS
jgi:hypothetical protein